MILLIKRKWLIRKAFITKVLIFVVLLPGRPQRKRWGQSCCLRSSRGGRRQTRGKGRQERQAHWCNFQKYIVLF